jgi:hypothetical protein
MEYEKISGEARLTIFSYLTPTELLVLAGCLSKKIRVVIQNHCQEGIMRQRVPERTLPISSD